MKRTVTTIFYLSLFMERNQNILPSSLGCGGALNTTIINHLPVSRHGTGEGVDQCLKVGAWLQRRHKHTQKNPTVNKEKIKYVPVLLHYLVKTRKGITSWNFILVWGKPGLNLLRIQARFAIKHAQASSEWACLKPACTVLSCKYHFVVKFVYDVTPRWWKV